MSRRYVRGTLEERFWDSVDKRGPDECWPWNRSTSYGYGQINNRGEMLKSHRLTFYIHHGRWPLVCCHSCDNRLCCNPAHLFEGTRADNNSDMWRKGRGQSPFKNGHAHVKAKLDTATVLKIIRAKGKRTQLSLAEQFGVSRGCIQGIHSGRTWGHLRRESRRAAW